MNSLFFAALTAAPEKIPELKPPRGTLPPSLWEVHGWTLIALALILGALIIVVIRRWRQPEPVTPLSPAAIAQRELAALRNVADESRPIGAAPQVLRRFLIAKFALAGPGLTAQEIAAHLPTSLPLAAELQHFLEAAEVANFAPQTMTPPTAIALGEVERLVQAVEEQTTPPEPAA